MNLLPTTQNSPHVDLVSLPYISQETFRSARSIEVTAEKQAASLQHGVFFRLISHMIRPKLDPLNNSINNIDECCTVTKVDGTKYIDLSVLPKLLKCWRSHVEKTRTSTVLEAVRDNLQMLLTFASTRETILELWACHEQYEPRRASNDMLIDKVDFSVQVVGESMWDEMAALRVLYDSTPYVSCPFSEHDQFVRRCLESAGWLASEIALLPQDSRFRYYLSRFHRSSLGAPHLSKSGIQQSAQVENSISRDSPLHISSDCSCSMLSINSDLLISKWISSGDDIATRFPIVSYTPVNGLRITSIERGDHSQSFVVFSHVRSQGLGNLTANALPLCQVQWLQSLANSARQVTAQDRPMPFWIDTLCLPLSRAPKTLALGQIEYIFRYSQQVIVLDRRLSVPTSASPQETLVHIRYSSWSKRLWTLQEGAVAENLYFNLSGRLIRLQDVLLAYEHSSEYPVLRQQCFKDQGYSNLIFAQSSAFLEALVQLRIDLQAEAVIRRLSCSIEDYEKNRFKLRQLLRLGYLATPRLRLLAEAFESSQIPHIVDAICLCYTDDGKIKQSISSEQEVVQMRLHRLLQL